MIFLLFLILALLLTGYCVAILLLGKGFNQLVRLLKSSDSVFISGNLPTVSVIIAARNEQANLPALLNCLQQLQYPAEKLEICIVNDRSTDKTAEILNSAKSKLANLKVIHIHDTLVDFAPKKRAIDCAIHATNGEIIMLTDADCTPKPGWIRATLACYKENTACVIGYSPYRFDRPVPRIIKKMLALEFFSIAAVAAASAGLGSPATAAGCNLSYRRETWTKAQGFKGIQQWISGDDDLFVLKIAEQKLGDFSYGLSPEAFVPAAAPTSWQSFWNQRIRYASKGTHYALPFVAALCSIYLFNLLLAGAIPMLLLGWTNIGIPAIFAWIIKSIFEWHFLEKAAFHYGEDQLLKFFLPTALLHPFYIVLFGFLGTFSRFDWHGEAYNVSTGEMTGG